MRVMMQAVEATPALPAESVPPVGNFYSANHPEWPPLPGNIYGLAAWPVGDGFYLLDDRYMDCMALSGSAAQMRNGMRMMGSESSGGGLGLQAPQYTTNDLWLEIVITNSAASLIVHSP